MTILEVPIRENFDTWPKFVPVMVTMTPPRVGKPPAETTLVTVAGEYETLIGKVGTWLPTERDSK
jgi:hypothetical protein